MLTIVEKLPNYRSKTGKKRDTYVEEEVRNFLATGAKYALVTNDKVCGFNLYNSFHSFLHRHPYLKKRVWVSRRGEETYLIRMDF